MIVLDSYVFIRMVFYYQLLIFLCHPFLLIKLESSTMRGKKKKLYAFFCKWHGENKNADNSTEILWRKPNYKHEQLGEILARNNFDMNHTSELSFLNSDDIHLFFIHPSYKMILNK